MFWVFSFLLYLQIENVIMVLWGKSLGNSKLKVCSKVRKMPLGALRKKKSYLKKFRSL